MSHKPTRSLSLSALLMLVAIGCLIRSPFRAGAAPSGLTASYGAQTDTRTGERPCVPAAVNCGGCPQEPRALPSSTPAPPASISTKWDLWSAGTALRGANIWQAAVYGGSDKTEFQGMETRYDEPSFAKLRRWGANYINISHPGTFSVQPLPVPGGRLKAYPLWENFQRRSDNKGDAHRLKTVVSTMPGKHGRKKNNSEVPRETLVKALSSESEYHTTETAADRGDLFEDLVITFPK
jgi:hypothetical protein